MAVAEAMSCWYTAAEDERSVRSCRSCVCAWRVDVSRGGGGTMRERGDGGGLGLGGTVKSWVRAEKAGRLVLVLPAVAVGRELALMLGTAVAVVVVVVVVVELVVVVAVVVGVGGVATLTPDGLLRCPFAAGGGGGGGIDVVLTSEAVDGRRTPGSAASCFDVAPTVFAPLFAPVPALALVAVVAAVAVLSVFPAVLDLNDMALPKPPSGALSTVAALPLDNALPSFAGSLVEALRAGFAPTPSTFPKLLLAAVASASLSSSVLALPPAVDTDGALPVLRGGASLAALLFLRLAVRGADDCGGGGGGGILAASARGEPFAVVMVVVVRGEVELVPGRECGGE